MTKVEESIRTPRPSRRRKPAKGQRVGYLRVSSLDQNEVRQLEGLALNRTFTDKASGKDVKRPQLEAMQSFVREGDTVFCHSMDRLAHNLDDLRRIVLGLTERGVHIVFVKENLTFTGEDSPMSNMLLSVMGAFAQFERELIGERQREGIAIAKREGKYTGRKPSLSPTRAAELRRRVADGDSKAALAREFGISRDTLYRYVPVKKRRARKPSPCQRGSRRIFDERPVCRSPYPEAAVPQTSVPLRLDHGRVSAHEHRIRPLPLCRRRTGSGSWRQNRVAGAAAWP
jgi:DNA invertase Pin-like site-specific DNA recombinase